MSKIWKTLKVFISSTFLDLELERDRLAHVFVEIERDILVRQLTIRPYDLRWRDRHSEEPIADWCLRMVQECDYFIGILGNRYGWRPLQADGQPGASVTEMEMDTALRCISPEKRFFCFTDFATTEESATDREAITALKQRLEQQGEKVFRCASVEELLATIDSEFRGQVDRDYSPESMVEAESYTYRDALAEIIAEKKAGFVGRDVYLRELREFASGGERPNYLALKAVAGTGKSALLACFITACRTAEIPVIAHFMSMSTDSREVNGIFKSLAEQLLFSGLMEDEPGDPQELRMQVREVLEQMATPVVLVVDGLDEVSENGRDLAWLPATLPANVRVVVSTRPVDTAESLARYPFCKTVELPPLDHDEIRQIIDTYLRDHQLQLNEDDRELLHQRADGNPLFLKVALDEIAASGVAIGQLALTVEALFDQILGRLERECAENSRDRKFRCPPAMF